MPHLVFRFDDGGEEMFLLKEPVIGVGRDGENSVVIDNDLISGRHARLVREEDGGYRVEDLNSGNGTFVNDAAIEAVRLQHGDRIRFGIYEVSYVDVPESPVSTPLEASVPAANPAVEASPEGRNLESALQAKRQQLEILESRVAQMEEIGQSLEEKLIPVVNPVALKAGNSGGSLVDEVARLEARYEDIREALEERQERLRSLVEQEVPEAERQVAEAVKKREEALAERNELQAVIQEAEERKQLYEGMDESYERLQAAVTALEEENEAKKALLDVTQADLSEAEVRFREIRDSLEGALREAEEMERRREQAEAECQRFAEKIGEQNEVLQAAQGGLEALREETNRETEKKDQTIAEREEQQRQIRHAQERLRLAEERVKGVISSWDEYEQTRLLEISQRKGELDEQYASSEARLRRTREELQQTRQEIEQEREQAQAQLEDLRLNHYEPTRQLHEELLLRNEALANELTQHEQQLGVLQRSIEDSEETEKLVSQTLEQRGQVLETLEQRIEEEMDQIRAEFVSLQRPVAQEAPPRIPDFGPIFRTRETAPPVPGSAASSNGSAQISLVVFMPEQHEGAWDFRTRGELRAEDEPLPLGFSGLAAATRGAAFSSLAMTVESGLPVLFQAAGTLADTVALLKKLRSAMPKRKILVGWTREAFQSVTEELHAGTNFQDLIGILSMSNGSITTDPYMNTFFESLNQGKRFLYLAPVLPWDPRAQSSFGRRKGLLVDLAHFDPENLWHQQIVRELSGLVEETRQVLTLTEPSQGAVRRFRDLLGLGQDWVRVQSPLNYREWLGMMREHLAAVSFDAVTFQSGLLRDGLLSHTPVVGPSSEALNVFYPEVSEYAEGRGLPTLVALQRLFEEENHERITRQAEKRLLSDYSYQAAAKKLDEFLISLPK